MDRTGACPHIDHQLFRSCHGSSIRFNLANCEQMLAVYGEEAAGLAAELRDGYSEFTIDFTLRGQGENATLSGSFAIREKDSYDSGATRYSGDISISRENVHFLIDVHMENQMQLKFTLDATVKKATGTIPSAPSAGSVVIDYDMEGGAPPTTIPAADTLGSTLQEVLSSLVV